MLDKLSKVFGALREEVSTLSSTVERLEAMRPQVRHGVDGAPGTSPDPQEIAEAAAKLVPIPKDGVSPDLQEIAEAAAKLIPAAQPGRDAIPPTVRDVADVVLAKMPIPKDGVSPDLQEIAAAAAKLVPIPKDGVSPTAAEVAKKMPNPQRGKTGAPGKNGTSITDVKLTDNELFVSLDGKKKSVGKIKVPAPSAPFRPGGTQGGGGARTAPDWYRREVPVTEAAQLSGTLRSDTVYFIDGIIDFTGTGYNPEVPPGGLTISGHGALISQLICSDPNFTLFTSPAGGSGSLVLGKISTGITGTGSKVHGIKSKDGFSLYTANNVLHRDPSSLGYIDNYFQGLESVVTRQGGTPELELRGVWLSGFLTDTANVFGLVDGDYPLYKAGAGFSMLSRFRTNASIDLPASASLADFSGANFPNPSTLQFAGVRLTRDGVANAADTNLTPNIMAADLASDWSDNNGLSNTFVGGELDLATEIETVIAVAGEFVDLAGTTTGRDLQHFDQPANGQLRHLGSSPLEFEIVGDLAIDGIGNDVASIKIVVFRDATSSFEDQKTVSRQINNFQGGRDVGFFPVSDNVILNKNDYVKLMATSASGANITVELDSFWRVKAR